MHLNSGTPLANEVYSIILMGSPNKHCVYDDRMNRMYYGEHDSHFHRPAYCPVS